MHGIIFTSLRQFVTERFGVAAAARAWRLEPNYLITRAYPDEQLSRLVERLSSETGVEPDDLLREFGAYAGGRTFVLLFPSRFEEAADARTFLLGVEEHIHELVRATVPSARPPRLVVEAVDSDALRITYDSPRRLCPLLEGLLVGTAGHYGEEADYDQVTCMLRGDDACVFEIKLRRG